MSQKAEVETQVVAPSEESLSRFLDDAWNQLASNRPMPIAESQCDGAAYQDLAEGSQTVGRNGYNILDRLLEGEQVKSSKRDVILRVWFQRC